MAVPSREGDLYEVSVVPRDPDLRKDVDVRIATFESCPNRALEKIKRYLAERNHFSVVFGECDFVVQFRTLVE